LSFLLLLKTIIFNVINYKNLENKELKIIELKNVF